MDKMKKLLLVDDDKIHLSLAEIILKDKFEISTVKSGQEALTEIAKGNIPDLILLDIIMPEMDGWETYLKLKDINILDKVPIVFLTSSDAEENKIYAKKIGAADYITKPCNRTELLNRIEALI